MIYDLKKFAATLESRASRIADEARGDPDAIRQGERYRYAAVLIIVAGALRIQAARGEVAA